jgi:predicted transglutaminase-like cysteine proteinase
MKNLLILTFLFFACCFHSVKASELNLVGKYHLLLKNGISSEQQKTIKKVFHNFNYILDVDQYNVDDKWVSFDNADNEKFYGDCEDLAFTLQKIIGGRVFKVKLKDSFYSKNPYHAVLVLNNVVIDNINGINKVDDYFKSLAVIQNIMVMIDQ